LKRIKENQITQENDIGELLRTWTIVLRTKQIKEIIEIKNWSSPVHLARFP
jgi:hypothetical protein